MIKVTDKTGAVHEYTGDGEEASFETEDLTNNLVIDSPSRYAVFAAGEWIKAEIEKCL